MKKYHDIKNLCFAKGRMKLTIDGVEKTFAIKDISAALEQASEVERNTYEISPSGYGIHWPIIDEDIAIDSLPGVVRANGPTRKTA